MGKGKQERIQRFQIRKDHNISVGEETGMSLGTISPDADRNNRTNLCH